MGKYIGCDLGGTNIKGAIVDSEKGIIYGVKSIPTMAHKGHNKVIERIAQFFTTLIDESGIDAAEIKGAGIGLPGAIDSRTGVSIFMTNLPDHWIKVPVADIIKEKTGIPTFLLNDVNAITWGELRFGAARNCASAVCFALGTGIGGGIVIDGHLVLGKTGVAGELGHLVVEPHGNSCNCGGYGCLETYASGPAIRSAALKAIAHGATSILGELCEYDLNKLDARTVAKAAQQGDKIAIEIYNKAGFYLGIAVSNMIMALEPDRVIITGGVAAAGDLLLNPIRKVVKERVHVTPLDGISIVAGELGDDAGVIGNSMWAESCLSRK
jgi:glucokinase